MDKKVFQLDTLTCPNCVVKIETTLNRMPGIEKAEVMFNASKVRVSFDETALTGEKIKDTIVKLGYDVLGTK